LTVLVMVIFIALMRYGFIVLVNTGVKSSQSGGTTADNSSSMQMNPTTNPDSPMNEMGGLITLIEYDK
jgi:hypothetical protein